LVAGRRVSRSYWRRPFPFFASVTFQLTKAAYMQAVLLISKGKFMTEFTEASRKRCRNKHCRMNLPTPVTNPREAFCSKGCYGSFYLRRCLVCEDPIERTTGNRKICKKSKCRNALAAGLGFGRYHGTPTKPNRASQNLERTQEVPVNGSVFSGSKPPEWRHIAGPPLTPNQLHCEKKPRFSLTAFPKPDTNLDIPDFLKR